MNSQRTGIPKKADAKPRIERNTKPSSVNLSINDLLIVRSLTRSIRVTTADQLSKALWHDSPSGLTLARRCLSRLIKLGMLQSFKVRAHPELELAEPLWTWKPGESLPPFNRLSYRARTRWTEAFQITPIYVASAKAARVYAGFGGPLPHPLHVTHDLHVAAIYLRMLRESPAESNGWISESVLAPLRRGKLPDAEIHDAGGIALKVIEFAGSYPVERIAKVHQDCERRNLPYELW